MRWNESGIVADSPALAGLDGYWHRDHERTRLDADRAGDTGKVSPFIGKQSRRTNAAGNRKEYQPEYQYAMAFFWCRLLHALVIQAPAQSDVCK